MSAAALLLLPLLLQGEKDVETARPEVTIAPRRELELGLSPDAISATLRSFLRVGEGHLLFGLVVDDDDDVAGTVRMMRYSEPSDATPVVLGVGIGFTAVALDRPDEEAYALTLSGSLAWPLPLDYPTSLDLEVSFAPDISTFGDGEGLLDASLRLDVDVSDWASAFVGVRLLEVDRGSGGDHELEDGLQIGVRLGF